MNKVICTPLRRISHIKGDLLHAMKKSDVGYDNFGEAYFTSVLTGEIKGWKKHTKMTLNLVVPVGSVIFYTHDELTNKTEKFLINKENYCRLTVKPGIWLAFEGEGADLNLILNIASIEHDPTEAINQPLNSFSFI